MYLLSKPKKNICIIYYNLGQKNHNCTDFKKNDKGFDKE